MGKTLSKLLASGLVSVGILTSGCETTPGADYLVGGLLYHAAERAVENEVDNAYGRPSGDGATSSDVYGYHRQQLKKSGATSFTCNSVADLNGNDFNEFSEFVNIKDTFSQGEEILLVFYFNKINQSKIGTKGFIRFFKNSQNVAELPWTRKKPAFINMSANNPGVLYQDMSDFAPGRYKTEFYDEKGKLRFINYFRIVEDK